MIWYILTKRYVSIYWRGKEDYDCGYETTANNRIASNMACKMCLWAKSVKYHKEYGEYDCNHFENI